jgi:hypothetical protein
MAMVSTVFELSCMLCGTEVGAVRDGRFLHHRGCERQPVLRGGFLRCCRCGGSLYRERGDTLEQRTRDLTELMQRAS